MKCNGVRHHLLASEKLTRPPAAVAIHLAECSLCREWQRQLQRMERLVPQMPVPASDAKANFLRDFLRMEPAAPDRRVEVPWRRRERALRKVAITFAMAAGLLFFALIWYAWEHQSVPHPRPPRDNKLEQLVNRYDGGALDPAVPPRERVHRLAEIAQHLQSKTKDRVEHGTASEVTELARQYELLVQEGILVQALGVPAGERQEVLSSVADQLSRTASDAKHLAGQYPLVAQPLGYIEVAANKGNLRLRELASGKG
jgi:hypothetical protein